jgi:hypothetical protein
MRFYNPYSEDAQLEADYEAYLEAEYENYLETQEENYIYDTIIIPQYFKDLELEESVIFS